MPPAPVFPPAGPAGQGDTDHAGGMLRAWREVGRWGLGFCKSLPHLRTPKVCASGPALNQGCGPACSLYPSSIHPVEPAWGWAGGEEGGQLPVEQRSLQPQPCFHPACRCSRFGPSSLQGQAEGGQQAEPGPISPFSPAACAPCFCCLMPRSLHRPEQPWLPSLACPVPWSHSGGDRGSGMTPSPAPICSFPGRRHGGQCPGSPPRFFPLLPPI